MLSCEHIISPDKKLELTQRLEYLQKSDKDFVCNDHLRFLKINYSCVETGSQVNHAKNLYLVEKNFQKFFMKVRSDMTNYELALEKTLKEKHVGLRLFSHKVEDSKFVGIYQYKEIRGTMADIVERDNLTIFDKYNYMLNILKLVNSILEDRDPKSAILDLNLSPENILILKDAPHSVKMIDIFPYTAAEKKINAVPDTTDKLEMIDARMRNIFLLGKLFFFICFRRHLDESTEFSKDNLEILNYELLKHKGANFPYKILTLIRNMLNTSPVDRPDLSSIKYILRKARDRFSFSFEALKDFWNQSFYSMKIEVLKEKFMERFNLTEKSKLSQIKPKTMIQRVVQLKNKIKKIYGREFYQSIARDVSGYYAQLPNDQLNRLFGKMSQLEIFSHRNLDDPFNMIDDMEYSDLFLESTYSHPERVDKIMINNQNYYLKNYIDYLSIGEETINYAFIPNLTINAIITDGKIYFNDELEKRTFLKKYRTVNITHMFLLFLLNKLSFMEEQQELFGIDREEVFESKVLGKMNNIAIHRKKSKANESIGWEQAMQLVIMPFFTLIFLMIFLLKKFNHTEYQKMDFQSCLIL